MLVFAVLATFLFLGFALCAAVTAANRHALTRALSSEQAPVDEVAELKVRIARRCAWWAMLVGLACAAWYGHRFGNEWLGWHAALGHTCGVWLRYFWMRKTERLTH
ncbi:MAG TPA: hypothetical protein VD862_04095 [Candidatus Paceibacterota bacterium]|nr:hypothetical protein [Candidatus Paceibacterota bacterium]